MSVSLALPTVPVCEVVVFDTCTSPCRVVCGEAGVACRRFAQGWYTVCTDHLDREARFP